MHSSVNTWRNPPALFVWSPKRGTFEHGLETRQLLSLKTLEFPGVVAGEPGRETELSCPSVKPVLCDQLQF